MLCWTVLGAVWADQHRTWTIGKNNNTRTVQAESSKFASVLFDQGFQIWIGWNWSERHLSVFCIDPIVPSFVVYYQIKLTGNTPWKKAKSNKPFNLRVLEYCTKFIFLSCVWSIRVQKLNKATKNLLFYSGVVDKIITLILKTCTKSKD